VGVICSEQKASLFPVYDPNKRVKYTWRLCQPFRLEINGVAKPEP
jgi:hypothetical protein